MSEPGMTGRLQPIRRLLGAFAARVLLPLRLGAFLAVLLFHHRRVRGADHILVYREGGFGHTIVWPDAMRRRFRDKKNLILFFYCRDRYNYSVKDIWPDIDFLWLPVWPISLLPGSRISLGWTIRDATVANVLLVRLLKLLFPRKRIFDQEAFYEVLPGADLPRTSADVSGWRQNQNARYFFLRQGVSAAPPRLPLAKREWVCKQLSARLSVGGAARLCGLYLRRKGGEPSSANRSGSPLEDYVSAIEFLIDSGYAIVLTGDRRMSTEMSRRFSGRMIDCRDIGVDWRLVSLYVATEADIFIAEAGGGQWLPSISGIPVLHVNSFPYLNAMPGSTVVYKLLRRKDGSLVHYSELFERFSFDHSCHGYEIVNNSRDDILQAVQEFLDYLATGEEPRTDKAIIDHVPPDGWLRYMNARVSPVWLLKFAHRPEPESRVLHAAAREGRAP